MQSNNPYSEQSYMLYSCDSFYVRMTYWPILSNNTKVRESQSSLFSYGMVHDHNFSLLTTGYLGDGYKTKLWEYDYNKVIGYPNEVVDLKFLEETRLTPDKALFYRPSKDIHCQYAPENEDSLALNIILKSHKQFDNRQYEFDIENKKIKKILYGSGSSKFSIIKLASLTNNSKTIDLLKQLVINNEIPLVRKECLDSLYKIEKTKDIWELGVRDKDKSISEYSKLKLEGKL